MSARVLPTRDLAFAGYPQRDVESSDAPWRHAWRWWCATARRGGSLARLPDDVASGLQAGQMRLAGVDDEGLLRVLPGLRARLRKAGLRGQIAGAALAFVSEMARRRLGLAPYPTQCLAAWLMLDGQLAEMATGEGKTLAAGIAAATAALAGVPVHLLTANDYLVQRDRDKLSPLYGALGLSSTCVLPAMARPEREAAYRSDIVYLTARELVFDYLRDHLILQGVRDPRMLRAWATLPSGAEQPATDFGRIEAMFETSTHAAALDVVASRPASDESPSFPPTLATTADAAPVLPGLCLALVDEADSILLDEATVPLILAAPADPVELSSYQRAMAISRSLRRGRDYALHSADRRCELTPEGQAAVAAAIDALPGERGLLRPLRRAHELVTAALTARHTMQRDRDYAVVAGKLQLIDEVTGRIADGRQWTGPLQAMVELKEGLEPSPATRVSAQITYQRFFPRYLRLGGMSGTLREAQRELRLLYGAQVRRVPLARPDLRQWLGERLYVDTAQRDAAVVERVRRMIERGRPVLIGTDSVASSQRVAACLRAAGIEHQLLNAVQDSQEAALISRAGGVGAVTVATNMAGRGTDISLDKRARAAGGLHVIATMRNRSPRIDRQLIGRAARHGDPGSAEAMLALDDALFTRHWPATVRRALAHCARGGLVPSVLAAPFAAITQRRTEWGARALRAHLRSSDRQAEDLFAFAGGTE